LGRIKNRLLARLLTRFPALLNRVTGKIEPAVRVEETPWSQFTGPLSKARVALVTTAGVHLAGQEPFDMKDPDGDPTYRALPSDTPKEAYTITHDYYDHSDADRDLNIVFPIDRLREMAEGGEIGSLAPVNYGFMGHIDGPHIETLIKKTAPEVAARLAGDGVDVVLLTPG